MNKKLFFKLSSLGALALILAAAVMSVEWKVKERAATRDIAIRSIADQYALEQEVVGPILWVQCSASRSVVDIDKEGYRRKHETMEDCSYAMRPSTLKIDGGLQVGERYRGIYKTRVYLAKLRLHTQMPADGRQAKPEQTITGAFLVFGIRDPRGLKNIQIQSATGEPLAAKPGVPVGFIKQGFHVPLSMTQLRQGMMFDAAIELAGSTRLDFLPIAENNEIHLDSPWRHPSFDGSFLPDARDIGKNGFTAHWRVNDFATGGARMLEDRVQEKQSPSLLGVSLIDPVDAYTQTDRAVRYGFLFVLLTLGGVFLFEMLKSRVVHPVQYLLVGFAVVLFFLLLLALSEHLAFALAYLIAAAACTLLIAAYGRSLVGGWRGGAVLGVGYGLLYFGMYQLLASEDYALLMGAWLIFALLALVMYLTRRLDWNRPNQAEETA